MAESKGSLIAKSVSKHAGRAKEKVRRLRALYCLFFIIICYMFLLFFVTFTLFAIIRFLDVAYALDS